MPTPRGGGAPVYVYRLTWETPVANGLFRSPHTLDLPLMFLLLDGSLVNFHGGRMTFDQAKMRFRQIQRQQITGLWNPTYEWKVRQWITPGSRHFDPTLAAAAARYLRALT